MVQKQAHAGGGTGGHDRLQIGQILAVQRQNMGKAGKIGLRHLTALVAANVNTMTPGLVLRARIGGMADMPIAGSCRIGLRLQPGALGSSTKGSFSQRGSADIAKANEQQARR